MKPKNVYLMELVVGINNSNFSPQNNDLDTIFITSEAGGGG